MITLFSYLLTFLSVLFWIFRVCVTLFYQLEMGFFAEPLNVDTEILILFLTVPCFMLVLKRNVIGAAAYLALYGTYFGTALYNLVTTMQSTGITFINSSDFLLLCIGVIIPLLTFCDIVINRNRNGYNGGDKKTDWFYKNKDYDRQFDERADRNQYKNFR